MSDIQYNIEIYTMQLNIYTYIFSIYIHTHNILYKNYYNIVY